MHNDVVYVLDHIGMPYTIYKGLGFRSLRVFTQPVTECDMMSLTIYDQDWILNYERSTFLEYMLPE